MDTLQTRDVRIDRADSASRTLEISFASETPIQRFGHHEVLDLGRMDLARLNTQAPLLFNHDWDRLVGGVVQGSARVDGGKARAKVRFSKSDAGFNAFRDAQDGSLGVSVGYLPYDPVEAGLATDGRPIRRFASTVYELSLVSIPADLSVGVGRSFTIPPPSPMPDPIAPPIAPAAPAAPTVITNDDAERIARYAQANPSRRDEAVAALAKGMSFRDFVGGLKEVPSTIPGQSMFVPSFSVRGAQLPDRFRHLDEISQSAIAGGYSLQAVYSAGTEGRTLTGLEAELSKELERRGGIKGKGVLVPLAAMMGRGFVSNVGAQGGTTVGMDIFPDLIEFLRPLSKVLGLGAKVIGGLQGNLQIPKLTAGSAAAWVAETSPAPESAATFGQINLTRKSLSVYGEYTKELLLQSTLDIESVLRADFAAALAQAIDQASIHGTGVGPEPRGIAATTGVNTVTFGGAATWAKVVEFETALAVDNVPFDGTMGWLTSPLVRSKWRQISKAAIAPAVASSYLWAEESARVLGYRAEVSGNVVGDKVFFGRWSDLILGVWSMLDVVVDPYSKSRSRITTITSSAFVDIGVRHPESFAMSTDTGAA